MRSGQDENAVVGFINVVVSRQVHGTEHGHKASDQRGKIVGSGYHGEDADALVLVSLAQRRVEFRSAGGRHAGDFWPPCRENRHDRGELHCG